MLRFANLPLDDYFAFVRDDSCEFEYGEGLLAEFVSLSRRGLRSSVMGVDPAEFAAEHGSLLNPQEGTPLPKGIRSFFQDIRPIVEGESEPCIFVEPRILWRFHPDVMRDIALLDMFAKSLKNRRRTNGMMVARENLVVYETDSGERMCLYRP